MWQPSRGDSSVHTKQHGQGTEWLFLFWPPPSSPFQCTVSIALPRSLLISSYFLRPAHNVTLLDPKSTRECSTPHARPALSGMFPEADKSVWTVICVIAVMWHEGDTRKDQRPAIQKIPQHYLFIATRCPQSDFQHHSIHCLWSQVILYLPSAYDWTVKGEAAQLLSPLSH